MGKMIVTCESGTFERDTLQCCHCQKHWEVERGSKRQRGYCAKCGAVTCGDQRCDPCRPAEKRLDLYELGKIPASML
jgi:hypothetical protein